MPTSTTNAANTTAAPNTGSGGSIDEHCSIVLEELCLGPPEMTGIESPRFESSAFAIKGCSSAPCCVEIPEGVLSTERVSISSLQLTGQITCSSVDRVLRSPVSRIP